MWYLILVVYQDMNRSKPNIAQVVVGLPVEGPFDYSVSKDLAKNIDIGQRVKISFNRRNRIGYIVGFKSKSQWKKLNPIVSVLDNRPSLDANAIKLTKRFSEYYGCTYGEAIETYLPLALRKSKQVDIDRYTLKVQAEINKGKITLLHDVTFQDRWPLMIEEIQSTLKAKKSVIFLVPEMAHIAHCVDRLKEKIQVSMAVHDKKLSAKQEVEIFNFIKAGCAQLIVGTRSSVFAPTPNLGLIIVNEEENMSYKQEQTPHYHVHEVAHMRAIIEGAKLIFTSAVPTAETWQRAQKEHWDVVSLKPKNYSQLQIVDMTNYNPRKTSILSFPLQNAITKTLENRGRVVLLMNRRGFSTLTRCSSCGFTIKCERCDVNLTYMYSRKKMVCRYCNFTTDLPKVCPSCNQSYLKSMGTGIEKLESEVARLYPTATIDSFERDTKKFIKSADILVATQAILKYQDALNPNLIAFMNFDSELNRMDYRSAQKAFTLLVQLRQWASSTLLIQTRMRDSYCLKALQKMNFAKFYKEELAFRKELDLPPYTHMIDVVLRGSDDGFVLEQTKVLFDMLCAGKGKAVEICDPHPDIISKLRDKYRYSVTLKGKSIEKMLQLVKGVLKGFRRKKNIIVTINVDP